MGSSLARMFGQCSETGLDRAPDPGDRAHVLGVLGLLGKQPGAGGVVGVDRLVVPHIGIHQGGRRAVAVGVVDVVGDVGHDLRLQQVLEELMGVGHVRRVAGDVHVVEPDQRAFLGDEVGKVDLFPGFCGAGHGRGVIAGPGRTQAQVAIGQELPGLSARARAQIPAGHKVAASPIAKGQPVRKYNAVIGVAARDIETGDYVHTHNLAFVDFDRDPGFGLDVRPVTYVPEAERATFQGYVREDGRVGTRNFIGLIKGVD